MEDRALRKQMMGDFLREARIKAGLTQQDLAKKFMYSSAQFVSNWERGISLPPVDQMPQLAEVLRIPPRTMIEAIYEYQRELLRREKRQLIETFRTVHTQNTKRKHSVDASDRQRLRKKSR